MNRKIQNLKHSDWTTCLNSDQSLRFVVSVLHMIVIFMSTEAKTCNTIFSRQKKKKELSIKCIHIFDLNIWMAWGANSPFTLCTQCLGRDFSKEAVVESAEGLGVL